MTTDAIGLVMRARGLLHTTAHSTASRAVQDIIARGAAMIPLPVQWALPSRRMGPVILGIARGVQAGITLWRRRQHHARLARRDTSVNRPQLRQKHARRDYSRAPVPWSARNALTDITMISRRRSSVSFVLPDTNVRTKTPSLVNALQDRTATATLLFARAALRVITVRAPGAHRRYVRLDRILYPIGRIASYVQREATASTHMRLT